MVSACAELARLRDATMKEKLDDTMEKMRQRGLLDDGPASL